jgi:hypothetical protein
VNDGAAVLALARVMTGPLVCTQAYVSASPSGSLHQTPLKMIKLTKTPVAYEIHGKSEILGKFAPTAHGTFKTWHEAHAHATRAF